MDITTVGNCTRGYCNFIQFARENYFSEGNKVSCCQNCARKKIIG